MPKPTHAMRGLDHPIVVAMLLVLAASAPCVSTAETAPLSPPAETTRVEDIIVTARKVEEKLQDVPLAVTHRDAEQLRDAVLTQIEDLQRTVPSLYVRPASGQGTALVLQMRGQTQFDTLGTLDPSVAIYQDQFYLARPFGTNLSFVDVEQVQVLRGPQGTLFGRNTTGGAILLSTRDPDLDQWSGSLRSGVASNDAVHATGVLNLSLLREVWALRVVGQRTRSDGYAMDTRNDQSLGDKNDTLLRIKSLWQPHRAFSLLLTHEDIDLDQTNGPAELAFAAQSRFVDADGDGTPETPIDGIGRLIVATASQGMDSIDNYLGDPYRAQNNPGLELESTARVRLWSATASLDRDWGRIQLILGRRDAGDIANTVDFDSTPYPVIGTTFNADYRQHSAELQITGDSSRVQWAAGAYAFDEDARETTGGQAAGGSNLTDFSGDAAADSVGAYVQGNFPLSPALNLTLGLRHSADRKSLVSRNRVGTAQTGLRCAVPGVPEDTPCERRFSNASNRLNYLLGLDYRLADYWLIYSTLTTGYRSGGQNLRGLSEATYQPFEPEDVTQLEVGAKAEFLDRRLRANLALYRSEGRDVQRSILLRVNGFTSTFTGNIAEVNIHGGELELAYTPWPRLELGAALGIVRPEYERYVDLNGIDRADEEFAGIPETQIALSAAHTQAFTRLDWRNSLNWSWQDRVYNSQANIRDFAPAEQAAAERALTQSPVGLLNARSALYWRNGFELALWGRNLTDEVYATGGLGFNGLGIAVRFPQPDREVGVEIGYRF